MIYWQTAALPIHVKQSSGVSNQHCLGSAHKEFSKQPSSQEQFLPINPRWVVTPPASVHELDLPAQFMEQSFAHLAKHTDQQLYSPTPQQTYCKDANPFRLPQRLTGSSSFIRLDLSCGHKKLYLAVTREVTQDHMKQNCHHDVDHILNC